jgi:hypothetical protein
MKSLFGRKDKTSTVTKPPMPKLPTERDIVEDIENIKKNDPILSLAGILDKDGN